MRNVCLSRIWLGAGEGEHVYEWVYGPDYKPYERCKHCMKKRDSMIAVTHY